MKIRLECLPEQTPQAVDVIMKSFKVNSVSEPYANRGRSKFERTYCDVDFLPSEDNNTTKGEINL